MVVLPGAYIRRKASTIGVGNRPGVMVMTVGCIMIVLGLLYAFYVKADCDSRMKAAALARFAAAGKAPPREAMAGSRRIDSPLPGTPGKAVRAVHARLDGP